MVVCRFHGGVTPVKHGGYSKREIVVETERGITKTSISDSYVEDTIKVNQDLLKTAIEQYNRLLEANELYYKEREGTSKGGLELSEISHGGVDKKGEEYKTMHRKYDFSIALNAKANLINRLSKSILEMKKELGIVDSTNKIIFDINLG